MCIWVKHSFLVAGVLASYPDMIWNYFEDGWARISVFLAKTQLHKYIWWSLKAEVSILLQSKLIHKKFFY